jgi:hypothetical protein
LTFFLVQQFLLLKGSFLQYPEHLWLYVNSKYPAGITAPFCKLAGKNPGCGRNPARDQRVEQTVLHGGNADKKNLRERESRWLSWDAEDAS